MRIIHCMKKIVLSIALSFLCLTTAVHAADKPAAYPLNTCVVSGKNLDAMGQPVLFNYKEEGKPDHVVMFCCKSCIGKFKKDPAKYLAKLDTAEVTAKADKK